MSVQLVVSIFANAASIEHEHVGFIFRRGLVHAVGVEQAGDSLRIVLVHLAPVGADHILARHRANKPSDAELSGLWSPAACVGRELHPECLRSATCSTREVNSHSCQLD